MKSHPSKRYPIFAAFVDYYILSISVIILLSFISYFINSQLYTAGAAFLLLISLIVILSIYHLVIWKKVKFLSPGEKIIGGVISDNKKEWNNPFGKKRGLLFIFIFISLLVLGSDWNSINAEVVPLGMVIGKSVRFFLVYIPLVLFAMAKRKAVLFPAIIFLISGILSMLMFLGTGFGELFVLSFANLVCSVLGFICFKKYK